MEERQQIPIPEELKGTILEEIIQGVVTKIRSGEKLSPNKEDKKAEGILKGFPGLVVHDELDVFEQACTLLAEEAETKVKDSQDKDTSLLPGAITILDREIGMIGARTVMEIRGANVRRRVLSSFCQKPPAKLGIYAVCICGKRIIVPEGGVAMDDDLLAMNLLCEM